MGLDESRDCERLTPIRMLAFDMLLYELALRRSIDGIKSELSRRWRDYRIQQRTLRPR